MFLVLMLLGAFILTQLLSLPLALFTGHACLVLAVASECLLGLAYVMPPMFALLLHRVKAGVCQFDFLPRVAGLSSCWFFFSLFYT